MHVQGVIVGWPERSLWDPAAWGLPTAGSDDAVSSADYTRVGLPFRETLEKLAHPSSGNRSQEYTVQKGDNLTRIVRSVMQDAGLRPSNQELYEAVGQVARRNNLANPDLIYPGQQLDVSDIVPRQSPPPTPRSAEEASPSVAPASKTTVTPPPSDATQSTAQYTRTPAASAPGLATMTQPPDLVMPTRSKHMPRPSGASRAVGTLDALQRIPSDLLAASGSVPVHAALGASGGDSGRGMGGAISALNMSQAPPVSARKSTAFVGPPLPRGYKAPQTEPTSRPTVDLTELLTDILDEELETPSPQSPWRHVLGGKGRLTSEFGMRKDPFTGRPEFHHGLDIAAKSGTPVYAYQPGVVVFSGWKGGYGRVITVRHENGLESTYAHNARNLVNVGTQVDADTPIARVGSTGRSTGPHLHFELQKHGKPVDPVPHLTSDNLLRVARNSS